MAKTKTTEDFINKAKQIHGDKYNYSKTNYKGSLSLLEIICPIHGSFKQKAANHLAGKGCLNCAIRKRSHTKKSFIKKSKVIHGDRYDYTKAIYTGSKKKVEIICKKHGSFFMPPCEHYKGKGCPKCKYKNLSDKFLKSNGKFIQECKKIHGDEYIYSVTKYTGAHKKIKIICPIHGEFEQKATVHLNGGKCRKCSGVESKGERKIREFLEKNKIKFQQEKKFNKCKSKRRLPFDFYLPKQKLLIEYHGKQHYEPVEYFGGEETLQETQNRDKIKLNFAKENNIKLLTIPYTEIDNIEKTLTKALDIYIENTDGRNKKSNHN